MRSVYIFVIYGIWVLILDKLRDFCGLYILQYMPNNHRRVQERKLHACFSIFVFLVWIVFGICMHGHCVLTNITVEWLSPNILLIKVTIGPRSWSRWSLLEWEVIRVCGKMDKSHTCTKRGGHGFYFLFFLKKNFYHFTVSNMCVALSPIFHVYISFLFWILVAWAQIDRILIPSNY